MIFNNNTTYLGTSRIGANTKYAPGTGFAEALIESAQNDLAMFRAMLDVDAREMQMMNESAYTGEIIAFQEASAGGIFHKIAEIFKKLAEKVKGIFANFLARLRSLYMKDKDLVKKYEKEVIRKDLTDCTFKWSKHKQNKYPIYSKCQLCDMPSNDVIVGKSGAIFNLVKDTNKDTSDAVEKYLSEYSKVMHGKTIDLSSYEEDYHDECFDDEDSSTDYKDLGITIREICSYLTDYSKKEKEMKKDVRDLEKAVEKVVQYFEKNANTISKNIRDSDDKYEEDKIKKDIATSNIGSGKFSAEYGNEIDYPTSGEAKEKADEYQKNADIMSKVAQVAQSAILKDNACFIREMQFEHKQIKAAFMRAVTYRVKEEAFSFALAEAAAEEVEDVISSAISSTDIDDINNASLNVMDGDVSNDPEKLLYDDPVSYKTKKTDGYVDSTIVGKHESAYFGQMFW